MGSQWARAVLLLAALWTWVLESVRYRSLRGKLALVSDAGSSLGRDLSVQLAGHGCRVICVGRDPRQVQATLHCIQAHLDGVPQADAQGGCRGYACDLRQPGEALGLARAVTVEERGVDFLFVVPDTNGTSNNSNNNEENVDTISKALGGEFWPVIGFMPGMMARSHGEVVHVLQSQGDQSADKAELVADAWAESLHEAGSEVKYTQVRLRNLSARLNPSRTADVAHSIVSAVRLGSKVVQMAY